MIEELIPNVGLYISLILYGMNPQEAEKISQATH
jgi:hypothetical protein